MIEDTFQVLHHLKNKQRWATAENVGPGNYSPYGELLSMSVNKGDFIYCSLHGHHRFPEDVGSTEEGIVSEYDILCKAKKENNELTITPLGNRILIQKIEDDQVDSPFRVHDEIKPPSSKGIVIALGEGFTSMDGTKIPFQVNVGDEIIYSQYNTIIVKGDLCGVDKNYYLLNHGDILAKL